MPAQLYRMALMAWVLVRSTGWPGAIGVGVFLLAAAVTQSAWIGVAAGVVAGFIAYWMMTPKSPTP